MNDYGQKVTTVIYCAPSVMPIQEGLRRVRHVEGFQCVTGREVETHHADLVAVRGAHGVDQILIAAAEVAAPVRSAQRGVQIDSLVHDGLPMPRPYASGVPAALRQLPDCLVWL